MPYPSLLHPEPLSLQQTTPYLYLHRRHSNTGRSQSLWELWVRVRTRLVWALWASLVGMGFGSKCDFATPIILLGSLLCTWTSQMLQCLLFYWDFSNLGRGVSPHSQSSEAQPPLLTLHLGYLLTAAASDQTTIWPSRPTIGYMPWGNHNLKKKYIYSNVHCNTIYNS